jgi:hypothetical protein
MGKYCIVFSTIDLFTKFGSFLSLCPISSFSETVIHIQPITVPVGQYPGAVLFGDG